MTEPANQPERTQAAQAARKVELIVSQLDSLPTLPRIASQLIRMTRSDLVTSREVIELIKQDQAVTAKILSLARKAGSGIRDEIATVDKCVLLMGLEAVRSAALSVKVFELFEPTAEISGPFDLPGFWKHALATALAAERLGSLMPHSPGADAPPSDTLFVAGLLHDIGKAALHHCLPKSYAKVIDAAESSHAPLLALERKLLGIDHTVVGRRLAQNWNLPLGVADAIWLHHNPPAGLPESVARRGFAQVVHLADLLVRELRLGYSGNYSRPIDSDTLAGSMGIDPARLDEVRRWLPDELANRAELIGVGQIDSRDLYHEALKGANEELARLNAKLLDRSASLSAKAKYFDLLAELNRRVRPGSQPTEVVELIGTLLRPMIGVARLVAFSESPSESSDLATDPAIDGVVIDGEHGTQRFSLSPHEGEIEGLAAARRTGQFASGPSTEEFALFPLAGHLGWVHGQIGAPLPLADCQFLPLLAEGRWVGGLVFAAPANNDFVRSWTAHRAELLAVASAGGLAIRAAQLTASAGRIAEELAQSAESCAQLQDQLVRQKALASVGMMAAGAGHELNNPLMVISGRSELLAAEEPDPARKAALEQIRQNALRASSIITDLMGFAQPPSARPQRIDLPALVRQMTDTLTQAGIGVELKIDPDLPPASVDPAQLREVIQEVLDNAQQAMAAQDADRSIDVSLAIAPVLGNRHGGGRELVLTITDRGIGMEPFVLEHATDPFFSARPAGRGRGLGLARARRLIENNGGTIRLESVPKAGTTVRITVPVEAAPAPSPTGREL
jgi:putative nucleotidyltransferase with HDIG domain